MCERYWEDTGSTYLRIIQKVIHQQACLSPLYGEMGTTRILMEQAMCNTAHAPPTQS